MTLNVYIREEGGQTLFQEVKKKQQQKNKLNSKKVDRKR